MAADIEVNVLPVVIRDYTDEEPPGPVSSHNQWNATPNLPYYTDYTRVDEGCLNQAQGGDLDLTDYITNLGIVAPLEEFLMPVGVPTDAKGILKGIKIAFYFIGGTITTIPGLRFQIFIDPAGDDNRTQIGETKEIKAIQSPGATKQITWTDLNVDLEDWINAAMRLLVINSIAGSGLPEPDEPDFEFVIPD